MRALFTAKEALEKSGEVLEFLRVEGHSFRNECPVSDGHSIVVPCSSCRRKAAARKQVDNVLTLISVALSELQEQVKRNMPYVRRAKAKKRQLKVLNEALHTSPQFAAKKAKGKR